MTINLISLSANLNTCFIYNIQAGGYVYYHVYHHIGHKSRSNPITISTPHPTHPAAPKAGIDSSSTGALGIEYWSRCKCFYLTKSIWKCRQQNASHPLAVWDWGRLGFGTFRILTVVILGVLTCYSSKYSIICQHWQHRFFIQLLLCGLLTFHSLITPLAKYYSILQEHLLDAMNHIHVWQVSPQLSCGKACQT